MTFGCTLPSRGPLATPDSLCALATRAEELGFDHIWVSDHIVIPEQVVSSYPYAPTGVAPFVSDPKQPYCEPLASLCYLAGSTRRIKLGTHVLILPYREPVLAAKMVATLDYMSGGRVILGVGVGWMKEEFEALGLNTFAERGKVSDEYIRIFKELRTKDAPSYQGRYSRSSPVSFYPKPVQKPHPPIWVGGHTPAALRRAAVLGDGWMPIGLRPPAELEPAELGDQVDRLRDMSEKAGRPRDAVDIVFSTNIVFDPSTGPRRTMTGSSEEIGADSIMYQQVGVQHFIFSFDGDTLEQVLENMERFTRDVSPQAE